VQKWEKARQLVTFGSVSKKVTWMPCERQFEFRISCREPSDVILLLCKLCAFITAHWLWLLYIEFLITFVHSSGANSLDSRNCEKKDCIKNKFMNLQGFSTKQAYDVKILLKTYVNKDIISNSKHVCVCIWHVWCSTCSQSKPLCLRINEPAASPSCENLLINFLLIFSFC